MTLLLLTKENNNELYFVEKNLSIKLYKLLKSMNPLLKKNSAYEKTFPLFFLLNLATKKEFHLIVGQFILANFSENQNNLEDLFQTYLHNFNFFLLFSFLSKKTTFSKNLNLQVCIFYCELLKNNTNTIPKKKHFFDNKTKEINQKW